MNERSPSVDRHGATDGGDDALLRLAAAGGEDAFDAGALLWHAGDAAVHFAVIRRGIVAIRRLTAAGDTIVLGLFGPGDVIGLSAALAREPFPAEAVALASVGVRWIPAAPLPAAHSSSPSLRDAVDRALLAHTDALRDKIDIVSAGTVPRRLAALFLHLARRFGVPSATGAVTIEVGLTREQIGQLVSARTETVVRVLGRWQRAGWFDGGRARIELVRPDMLARILGT
ncbi:MAG TPA: Crp/Fnr family transcriptional regulator [Casimicrobiaceae bacterium]